MGLHGVLRLGGWGANDLRVAVKSFTSREDAEDFVAGKKVTAAIGEPDKFYAVAVGTPTGIFTDWTDASLAIKGVKGPKYKKFATRAEAVGFIRENGNKEAIAALGDEAGVPVDVEEQPAEGQAAKKTKSKTKSKNEEAPPASEPPVDDGILRIYTDGSSLANGKVGSRAGLGVYFGEGDSRNLSERLEGDPQTNQRAELKAMERALEIAPKEQPVLIFSDSQYSIKCVTQWSLGWKRKGWLTANGEQVKNQDIIRAVLKQMEKRAEAGGVTTFQWVKGHSEDRGNDAADRLAVRGAKM